MFPFKCLRCSRKCISAGRPYCFHCDIDGMDHSFQPTRTEPVATTQPGIAGESKNHLESLSNIVESLSNNQKTQDIQNTCVKIPFTVSQNIVSNCDVNKDTTNDAAPCKISDSETHIAEKRHSTGDILSVQGSSGLRSYENERKSNSENPSEIEAVMYKDQKPVKCRVCEKKIYEHIKKLKEKNGYTCCVCSYDTPYASKLYKHIYFHCAKKICKICGKEYAEVDLHEIVSPCKVCNKSFECKTLLDQHSLNHQEYYLTHCWGCSKKLSDHFTGQKDYGTYECCVCGYQSNQKLYLEQHNNVHYPALFCNICKDEYTIEEKSLHGSNYACSACEETFFCQIILEDHYIVHHEAYFNNYCMICNAELYDHKTENNGKSLYNCCKCKYIGSQKCDLQSHLRNHRNLRLYKCNMCGMRFFRKKGLTRHSKKCMEMPYKCEICSAKFPSRGSLDKHCFEKHREILGETLV